MAIPDRFPPVPENPYQYENQFSYSVWVPNTELQLCNVPWDSSYRDIVRFDSATARNNYFAGLAGESKSIKIGGVVYCRMGEPIRINAPFDVASTYNYVVVRNKQQPVPGSKQPDVFYYFITNVDYIAPNTSQLNLQLDVWQTYYNMVTFNQCYIERGHIGIANENATMSTLRDYLIEPEGLNLGDEYLMTNHEFINFFSERPYILLASSANLKAGWGDVSNADLSTATGGIYSEVPHGCELYIFDSDNFTSLMQKLASAPWVAQCIQMITVIPGELITDAREYNLGDHGVRYIEPPKTTPIISNRRISGVSSKFGLPSRFSTLLKFFSYPYSFINIEALNGQSLVLGLENWPPTSDNVYLDGMASLAIPGLRLVYYPRTYNARGDNAADKNYQSTTIRGTVIQGYIPGGDGVSRALVYDNFPQLSLVTNQYLNYLASTAHSRAYAQDAADWSQQRAYMGANLSYNQAQAGMENNRANQNVSNQQTNTMADISQEQNAWSTIQGVAGGAGNAISGAAIGGAGGAGAGLAQMATAGISGTLNADWINRSANAGIAAGTAYMQNANKLAGYIADGNLQLATKSADTDHALAIQSIQAKVQDARVTSPAITGQAGGEIFNFSNNLFGIHITWKTIKPSYMRQIGDFWLRYGYAINRFITPPQNLKCMTNFTYWKMTYCNLSTSPMPELFKDAIVGIFEQGTTVWNDPTKLGVIDLTNNAIVGGIKY